MTGELARASKRENLRFTFTYTLPSLLRGAAVALPFWTGMAARVDATRWGVATLARLRARYGDGPILVSGAMGDTVVVTTPEDARKVLDAPVDVYAMDVPAKRRTHEGFQPDGLVISSGDLRLQRRAFGEGVLNWRQDTHELVERFLTVVNEEIAGMLGAAERHGRVLDWAIVTSGIRRVARRCVFGDAAGADTALSEVLSALFKGGNRLGLDSWNRARYAELKKRLYGEIDRYVTAAEPGSLVSLFPAKPQGPGTLPNGQVAHWMMGLDLLRASVSQALALLASHPAERDRVLAEIAAADAGHGRGTAAGLAAMRRLRASLEDAVRLWPPVLNLVRTTTTDTDWNGTTVPAGTLVLIPLPVVQRTRLPQANRFAPDAWLDGSAEDNWLLSPFSRGDAQCPGRDLGLQLGTAMLAELLRQRRFGLLSPKLSPDRPLPYTINPMKIRFAVRERAVTRQVPRPAAASGTWPVAIGNEHA